MAEDNIQKADPTKKGLQKEPQNVGLEQAPGQTAEMLDLQSLQRAIVNPSQAGPEAILSLQQTAGNRAVSRLIQARLTVGPVGDSYEQEADRVADHVMKMPVPTGEYTSVQRQAPEEEEEIQTKSLGHTITPLVQRQSFEEEEVQTKSLIQRLAPEEEEEIQTKSLIQRQAPEEEDEIQTKSLIQRQAPEEEEEIQTKSLIQRQAPEEEDEIQTKSLIQRQAPEEEEEIQTKPLIQRDAASEEEEIQTKATIQRSGTTGIEVDAGLEEQITSSRGSGSPLPKDVRSFMEPRFGSDFGDVRIHTGSESAQINRSLNARAFTQGADIYFNEEGFDGGSSAGKELLAHELTHVVQQTGPRNLQRAVKPDPAGETKQGGEVGAPKTGSQPEKELDESQE